MQKERGEPQKNIENDSFFDFHFVLNIYNILWADAFTKLKLTWNLIVS